MPRGVRYAIARLRAYQFHYLYKQLAMRHFPGSIPKMKVIFPLCEEREYKTRPHRKEQCEDHSLITEAGNLLLCLWSFPEPQHPVAAA